MALPDSRLDAALVDMLGARLVDAARGELEVPVGEWSLNSLGAMQGGAVELRSARHGWTTHFAVATGRIDWPSPDGRMRAAVTGRWRGQPVDASWEIDRPLAVAHGEASAMRVAVDAPLTQLRIAGDWSPDGKLAGALYRGQISALMIWPFALRTKTASGASV